MKSKIIISGACLAAAVAIAGCSEGARTYSDAEYIMFADTASVNVVLQYSREARLSACRSSLPSHAITTVHSG